MQKPCLQCSALFEISPSDLAFYEEISPVFASKKEPIPPPKYCPDCRLQRRLLFRNDLCLYHRKSDLTGKAIVSIYSPEKPYKVFDQDEWWSDRWDELSFGRDFDFSRTFTEQFQELCLAVPHQALFTMNAENSMFTNHSINTRNCYLVVGATNLEDCLYGRFVISGHHVVDGLSLLACEWCYDGIASQQCYHCQFFRHSRNCSDCFFIDDCQSCRDCFMCFGLQSKQYCFLNEQLTKESYQRKLAVFFPLTTAKITKLRSDFATFSLKLPHRSLHVFGSEDCTGDMVFNSSRCHDCYDITDCEDCAYIGNTPKAKFSHDANYTAPDGVDFSYNVCSTVGAQRAMGTFFCWYGSDTYYSRACHQSSYLFGCVGIRHKQYCIFNKQYSKEEYEALVPRIIEHMRKTGEWGDYLRPELSTMGYNETLGQEYFPLTREEALRRGYKWRDGTDEVPKATKVIPAQQLPALISDIPDDILNWAIVCEVTGRPFKIIKQELEFYRRMNLPVPHFHPDERHRRRLALRNPRHLWKRTCQKCQQPIETTYAPDRPERVYCESCYLAEVY